VSVVQFRDSPPFILYFHYILVNLIRSDLS
jgi:hypothetical protein